MAEKKEPISGPADHVLVYGENIVYAAVGGLLAVGAVMVLGAVAYHLVTDVSEGIGKSVTEALDGMLLVFILLELLAAVRTTMREKKLVAEPFLVVGIIASIKEIVVLTLESKEVVDGGDNDVFRNSMVVIGVLGGVILLLALASYLVRRKEREPEEEEEAEAA